VTRTSGFVRRRGFADGLHHLTWICSITRPEVRLKLLELADKFPHRGVGFRNCHVLEDGRKGTRFPDAGVSLVTKCNQAETSISEDALRQSNQ
jgi:hypothetical protein